jgi:AraC-like DNA-binding protein
MQRLKPLSKFQVVKTCHAEEAEYKLSQTLTELQIKRIKDRDFFELEMNSFNFGFSSLIYNQFGTHTDIELGMDMDQTLFVFGRGGVPCIFNVDGQSLKITPQKGIILTNGGKVHIQRPKNSEVIVLRASNSDIWHHFTELTQRYHRGALVFDRSIDLVKGPGATLKNLIYGLVDELGNNDLVIKDPVLQKGYDHQFLTALLLLPHSKRDTLFNEPRYRVGSKIVRLAEEYIRAHLEEAISIIDLLRICGCSRRALFSAFRNTRGYTPMEFLTEQRLQSVRNRLLKSHVETSVASIALECGFTHLGRFSHIYKSRFGIAPSITLKKKIN